MEAPTNVFELKKLLGTINFIEKFILNLAKTINPLYSLFKKIKGMDLETKATRKLRQNKGGIIIK